MASENEKRVIYNTVTGKHETVVKGDDGMFHVCKDTVEDIVREMRNDAIAADAWHETHGEMASAASTLNRHADRIESAHNREIAELRECLKEAIGSHCSSCKTDWRAKCDMKNCSCISLVKRWRKALEGAKDAGRDDE